MNERTKEREKKERIRRRNKLVKWKATVFAKSRVCAVIIKCTKGNYFNCFLNCNPSGLCVCSVLSFTNTCARFICEWFLLFSTILITTATTTTNIAAVELNILSRNDAVPPRTATMTLFNDAVKKKSAFRFTLFLLFFLIFSASIQRSEKKQRRKVFVLFMDFIYERWKKILQHIPFFLLCLLLITGSTQMHEQNKKHEIYIFKLRDAIQKCHIHFEWRCIEWTFQKRQVTAFAH